MTGERARTLDELRKEIQDVDAAIIALLAKRMRIVRAIGEVKRSEGIAVVDPAREAAVVSYVAQLARDAGLPEDDVRELFWRIMALSRREQHAD
jgi:chorismate mutase / prephenate dehydrogenase